MGRITVLYPVSTGGMGGGERYVLSILEKLDRTRFRPIVAAPYKTLFFRKARKLCDEFYRIPFLDNADLFSFTRLFRIMYKADIVHANLNRACFFSSISGRIIGKPVISTMHGLDKSLYYRFSDRVVFLSEFQKQKYSYIPNSLHIPIGVSQDSFPQVFRQQGKVFNIGVLARLHHLKGHITAVKTARIMKERGFSVHFYFMGEGEYRPVIEKAVRDYEVEDMITFTGNLSDPAEFISRNIDLGMLASEKENIPMSNLEYMAMRIPVVCSDVGAVKEQLDEISIVREADNALGFAEKISLIINDPEIKERMIRSNLRRVRAEFNSDIMVKRLEELYEERTDIYTQ
ncbi:MAG: glycosyltransferase family 4 protein [Candidatus Muiribacteriaceae bacterium]